MLQFNANSMVYNGRDHKQLSSEETMANTLSFNDNYDASILRYYVDIYYARFHVMAHMSGCSGDYRK